MQRPRAYCIGGASDDCPSPSPALGSEQRRNLTGDVAPAHSFDCRLPDARREHRLGVRLHERDGHRGVPRTWRPFGSCRPHGAWGSWLGRLWPRTGECRLSSRLSELRQAGCRAGCLGPRTYKRVALRDSGRLARGAAAWQQQVCASALARDSRSSPTNDADFPPHHPAPLAADMRLCAPAWRAAHAACASAGCQLPYSIASRP